MTSPASTPPHPSMRGIASYFALAFAITWACQLPAVLAQRGLLAMDPAPWMPLVVLGVFGPMLAAIAVSALESGRAGVRALFAPLARWRISPLAYLVALGHPGLILALGMAPWLALGGEGALAYFPPPERVVAGVLISLGEEIGWRGFALPRLVARVGPLGASTWIGVLWALWHLPMLAGADVPLVVLPLMIPFFVAGSVVLTSLWTRTGGSLLVAVLGHLGAHLSNSHLALPDHVAPVVVHTVAYVVVATIVVLADRETFGGVRKTG